uniref:Uncharacterized protein n=1 Tax=Timema monikensis TaxID=170555 RepID=A0A7R9E997_9NEOP|nr:unnamed protein product [Timema monikensis]
MLCTTSTPGGVKLQMTGHIRTSFDSFFIEPAENWRDHTAPILHAVYRMPTGLNNNNADDSLVPHHCGVPGEFILP